MTTDSTDYVGIFTAKLMAWCLYTGKTQIGWRSESDAEIAPDVQDSVIGNQGNRITGKLENQKEPLS